MIRRPPRSPLFPYTPLSRSQRGRLFERNLEILTRLWTEDRVTLRVDEFNLREAVMRPGTVQQPRDRKSTRLNSSHGYISYAVFCLKKKKKNTNHQDLNY